MLGGGIEVQLEFNYGSIFIFMVDVGVESIGDFMFLGDVCFVNFDQLKFFKYVVIVVQNGKFLEGVCVMLVEDGFDNQCLILFVLKKVGVDVIICENGLVVVLVIEGFE